MKKENKIRAINTFKGRFILLAGGVFLAPLSHSRANTVSTAADLEPKKQDTFETDSSSPPAALEPHSGNQGITPASEVIAPPAAIENDMKALEILMKEMPSDEELETATQENRTRVVPPLLLDADTPSMNTETKLSDALKISETTSKFSSENLNLQSKAEKIIIPSEEENTTSRTSESLTPVTAEIPLIQKNPSASSPESDPKSQKNADEKSFFQSIQTEDQTIFWKTAAATLGALLAAAMIALQFIKSKRNGIGHNNTPAKALELISTLPIGPKRQIILVKIRDTEIAVSSTEYGVTLLSEVKSRSISATELNHLSLPEPRENSLININPKPLGAKMISLFSKESNKKKEVDSVSDSGSKSEILKRAIETIENRRTKEDKETESTTRTTAKPKTLSTPLPSPLSRPLARMNSARTEDHRTTSGTESRTEAQSSSSESASFAPKTKAPQFKKQATQLYAQASQNTSEIEHETTSKQSQRQTQREQAQKGEGTPQSSDEGTPSQTDNVAQLIRDKLKQMRAINS